MVLAYPSARAHTPGPFSKTERTDAGLVTEADEAPPEDGRSVAALREDPRLGEREREALIAVYRTLVRES